jgi:AcrR family transcriptional regulator
MNRPASRDERRSFAQRTEEATAAMRSAALELIAVQGLKGLTLGAVGAKAGVSRGLPNYHFGTKAALVLDVLDDMLARRLARYGARDELRGLDAILANLDSIVGLFREGATEQRGFAIMMSEGLVDADPEIRARIADYNRAVRALIADRFREAQGVGPSDPGLDAETLASLYVASLKGITLQWVAEGDLAAMDRSVRGLRALLLSILARGGSANRPTVSEDPA